MIMTTGLETILLFSVVLILAIGLLLISLLGLSLILAIGSALIFMMDGVKRLVVALATRRATATNDSLGDNFDGDCDGQLLNIFAYFCRNRDLRVGLI